MSNKKLSSIEWLVNEITTKYDKHFAEFYKSEIEQTKELHKQEIIEAYYDGTAQFAVDARIDYPRTAKEYYQQTFNQ